MSHQSSEPSRVIYIGSIPYDKTEEQILEIAKTVGPVKHWKLQFDKETGRSKGYCFIEYYDIETASSAVRNLNNYAIGNRFLKCNFAAENSMNGANSSNSNGYVSSAELRQRQLEANIPPLPLGVDVVDSSNEGLSQVISGALNNLHETRLNNLLKDAQNMAVQSPESMAILLKKNPQLSFALVQACLISGKLDSDGIQGLLSKEMLSSETTQEKQQQHAQTYLSQEMSSHKEQGQDADVDDDDYVVEGSEESNPNQLGSPPTQKQDDMGNAVQQELQNLSDEQLQAIRAIVGMSEQDILGSIPGEQQQLYLEIKRKYGPYM